MPPTMALGGVFLAVTADRYQVSRLHTLNSPRKLPTYNYRGSSNSAFLSSNLDYVWFRVEFLWSENLTLILCFVGNQIQNIKNCKLDRLYPKQSKIYRDQGLI